MNPSFKMILLFSIALVMLFKISTFNQNSTGLMMAKSILVSTQKPVEIKEEMEEEEEEEEEEVILPPKDCDLFTGKWVLDNSTHPLYKEDECQFLSRQVTCATNGRPDLLYQNWKWQPHQCSLPKFKARLLLRKLRGKRLMFVGDSLNRNQWESMICLLQSVVPPGKKSLSETKYLSVFKIENYNTTIEYYWAPFLVESNSDHPKMHSNIQNRILDPKSIDKHGENWKGVDYLVFNTYVWWMNTMSIKVLNGSFHDDPVNYDEIERSMVYREVLKTWGEWLEKNVDPKLTSVYFISMSPVHYKSDLWNDPNGIRCAKESTPIFNSSILSNLGTDKRLFDVAQNVTGSIKIPVHFINITALSEYRKEAHTSIYTLRQGQLLTPEEQADPATYADCIHWCLPGLPDTWNELLYTHIISQS